MQLVKGRPEGFEDRQEKEIRVYKLLDRLQIEYERVDHEEAATMEVCDEIDVVLNSLICKNLFLCNRQKTQSSIQLLPLCGNHESWHRTAKQVSSNSYYKF